MAATNKITKSVTLTAGGNKTFSSLTRPATGQNQGWQFTDDEDSGVSTTVTINLEISYDEETWTTLVDGAGDDVTGTLASAGTAVFSLSDVPMGAYIRPKFVTDATGTIVVTTLT
jgi:hypothetical protein